MFVNSAHNIVVAGCRILPPDEILTEDKALEDAACRGEVAGTENGDERRHGRANHETVTEFFDKLRHS